MADALPDHLQDTQHWHQEDAEQHQATPTNDPLTALKPYFSATLPKVQNPAHAALRIILRHPETAEHVSQIPSHLSALKMQDAGVLIQLLNTVQDMFQTLKRWPNPAELHIECATWDAWPMLRQLAAMESLLPQGNYPQQLEEAISRLLGHHFEERLNQLLHLASQPNADASIKKTAKRATQRKRRVAKAAKK